MSFVSLGHHAKWEFEGWCPHVLGVSERRALAELITLFDVTQRTAHLCPFSKYILLLKPGAAADTQSKHVSPSLM